MAKRPRTEAQRAASRANGRLSSGPKTVDGKRRSRRNALRHGLRASSLQLLLPAANQPVTDLITAVRERLAPGDAIENELADGIAMAFWRLRRARQLEEAMLAGGRLERSDVGLAKTLLKRTNTAGALPLLLRYRSQALGELSRFFRLLEAHRCGALADSPPESAHKVTVAAGDGPANDNRPADAAGSGSPIDPPLS